MVPGLVTARCDIDSTLQSLGFTAMVNFGAIFSGERTYPVTKSTKRKEKFVSA
jgi:hypothetical protein